MPVSLLALSRPDLWAYTPSDWLCFCGGCGMIGTILGFAIGMVRGHVIGWDDCEKLHRPLRDSLGNLDFLKPPSEVEL